MELPKYVFRHKDALEKIATEGAKKDGGVTVSNVVSTDFHGGIFVNYEGAEYPQKGIATPEILYHVNIMKAVFMGVFSLRPNWNSILGYFNRIGSKVLSSHFLKNDYRTAGTLELDRLVFKFLKGMGVKEGIAEQTSEIISHLFEYDNAYRLRIIDIASETTAEQLINSPRKEINRLLEIIYKREIQMEDVKKKFKYVAFVLKLGLFIPKIRRAWKQALRESDWSKMQYDNTDRYWACLRTDYNFMGMTYESRLEFLAKNNLNMPIQRQMEVNVNL